MPNCPIFILWIVLSLSLCEEEHYRLGDRRLTDPGIYPGIIKSVEGYDSIVHLTPEKTTTITVSIQASILKGDPYTVGNQPYSKPGEYRIRTITDEGCIAFVYLVLSNYNVYWPNAFSEHWSKLYKAHVSTRI